MGAEKKELQVEVEEVVGITFVWYHRTRVLGPKYLNKKLFVGVGKKGTSIVDECGYTGIVYIVYSSTPIHPKEQVKHQ